MPDPTDPNTVISLAMNPAMSDPAAWADCDACKTCGMVPMGESSEGEREMKTCPTCHGKGKVPVDWADPAMTLRLVEWATKMFWREKGEAVVWHNSMDEIGEVLSQFTTCTIIWMAASIRDIISKAIIAASLPGETP